MEQRREEPYAPVRAKASYISSTIDNGGPFGKDNKKDTKKSEENNDEEN